MSESAPLIGLLVPVEREGKTISLDITQLTNDELEAYSSANPYSGWEIAKILLKWIKNNVEVE
jgi:hypothetical protein